MDVQQVLGWNDEQFANYQMQCGYDYLRSTFGPDLPFLDEVVKCKAFWGWWKNHWTRRDEEFLMMAGLLRRHEAEEYYKLMHEPGGIGFTPHAEIMEETYALMISRAILERKEVENAKL